MTAKRLLARSARNAAPDTAPEPCALCAQPADIEIWTGYRLCRACRDRLGRAAVAEPEEEGM